MLLPERPWLSWIWGLVEAFGLRPPVPGLQVREPCFFLRSPRARPQPHLLSYVLSDALTPSFPSRLPMALLITERRLLDFEAISVALPGGGGGSLGHLNLFDVISTPPLAPAPLITENGVAPQSGSDRPRPPSGGGPWGVSSLPLEQQLVTSDPPPSDNRPFFLPPPSPPRLGLRPPGAPLAPLGSAGT